MKKQHFIYLTDLLLIVCISVFVLLEAFVIPQSYSTITETVKLPETLSTNTEMASVTSDSYQDDNISIQLNEYRYLDTTIHVADITISDISLLKTAFADNTYGKNITAKTSEIDKQANAILSINGDYYGARNKGYVLRNGVLYRTTSAGSDQEDLIIYEDGSFEILKESQIDLDDDSMLQIFSFGPGLISDYAITVDQDDEVDRAMTSNPRTVIAEIEPLHYLFIVADGRTDESEGLSLYEMAQFLETLNVKNAYNLDGGGSSTMIFNNNLINNPTTTGNSTKERSVSDIVYIGY